jgi:hypothetical protein
MATHPRTGATASRAIDCIFTIGHVFIILPAFGTPVPVRSPEADDGDDEWQHQKENERPVELREPRQPGADVKGFAHRVGDFMDRVRAQ